MCRLLGKLSRAPQTHTYELVDALHSLKKQSEYALKPTGHGAHPDGCGIAWLSNSGTIGLEKRGQQDRWDESFCDLVKHTETFAFIAHNRAASKGLLVSGEITHPYLTTWRGRPLAFCHNGEVGSLISEAAARKTTDSQLFMEHFVAHIKDLTVQGITDYLSEVSRVWKYSSLNALVLTQDTFCAWRWYHDDPNSTFDRERYYSLCTNETEGQLIVSSEPVDDDPRWCKLSNRSIIVRKI